MAMVVPFDLGPLLWRCVQPWSWVGNLKPETRIELSELATELAEFLRLRPFTRRSKSPQPVVGQCQGFPSVTRIDEFGHALRPLVCEQKIAGSYR